MLCCTCRYNQEMGYKNIKPDDDYPIYYCSNEHSEHCGDADYGEGCEHWVIDNKGKLREREVENA